MKRMDISKFKRMKFRKLYMEECGPDEFWFGNGHWFLHTKTPNAEPYEEIGIPVPIACRKYAELLTAAPDLLVALRAAYKRIDYLTKLQPKWKTITDDPKSLPEPMKPVLLDVGLRMWDYGYLNDDEYDPPMWDAFSGIYPIGIGHRWAYAPEVK